MYMLVWCGAQGRRAALGALAGSVALVSGTAPSFADHGAAANVFGKKTSTGGASYVGDGFALKLPPKWNPSKEKDFPGVQLRWVEGTGGVLQSEAQRARAF
jgi:hypothetical protein